MVYSSRLDYSNSSTDICSLFVLVKMNVDHEVELLVEEMKRLSSENDSEGRPVVPFGVLFNDTRCANIFEALVGTLRAAKRKKVVAYEGQILLQGKNKTRTFKVGAISKAQKAQIRNMRRTFS